MTVISLVQSNIVHPHSSVYKEEVLQKDKAKKLLAIGLIFLILALIFLYILQVNSIATKGYKIRGLKKQAKELTDKNTSLQVYVSNLKSVNVLQARTESFNMIEAQNIEYVTLPPASVVVAK